MKPASNFDGLMGAHRGCAVFAVVRLDLTSPISSVTPSTQPTNLASPSNDTFHHSSRATTQPTFDRRMIIRSLLPHSEAFLLGMFRYFRLLCRHLQSLAYTSAHALLGRANLCAVRRVRLDGRIEYRHISHHSASNYRRQMPSKRAKASLRREAN